MNRQQRQMGINVAAGVFFAVLLLAMFAPSAASQKSDAKTRVPLDEAVVLVDAGEPSYIQYGAHDLSSYLSTISGKPVPVSSSPNATHQARSIIAIGEKMA